MSNITTVLCVQAFLVFNQVLAKESSACYGTDIACDFYRLECLKTELIKLNTLQYGYKRGKVCLKSEEACKENGGCCKYSKLDCTNRLHEDKILDIYTNCSGKSMCGPFQAPWVDMSYCGPTSEVITSDYFTIEYECIDKKEQLDICNAHKLLTDHVYLMFDGSVKNSARVRPDGICSCSFTGVDKEVVTRVAVTIIDVRLRKSANSLDNCTAATLRIKNKTFERKCTLGTVISNFYHNLNHEYMLTNGTLDITLEGVDSNDVINNPSLIWIQVKGNKSFHVSCNQDQRRAERSTILPELWNEIFVTTTTFSPTTSFYEPSDSSEKSEIRSKVKDNLYNDTFHNSAAQPKVRDVARKRDDVSRNHSENVMITASSVYFDRNIKIENESGGYIITTGKAKGNLGTNDSTLYQKDIHDLDDYSYANQLVANIVIPVFTGGLMTIVVILSVYVKCRTRRRTGKLRTNASEGTFLDEESETETRNENLSSRSQPEALVGSDVEMTKL